MHYAMRAVKDMELQMGYRSLEFNPLVNTGSSLINSEYFIFYFSFFFLFLVFDRGRYGIYS